MNIIFDQKIFQIKDATLSILLGESSSKFFRNHPKTPASPLGSGGGGSNNPSHYRALTQAL